MKTAIVGGMSPPRDQVVKHDGNPPAALHVLHPLPVLEDHHSCGLLGLVLSRNIDRPVANGAREDLRFPRRHLLDGPVGNIGLFDGVGMRSPLRLRFDMCELG